jgi:hypothetical protein
MEFDCPEFAQFALATANAITDAAMTSLLINTAP